MGRVEGGAGSKSLEVAVMEKVGRPGLITPHTSHTP